MSHLTAFLIYTIKHRTQIDTPRMILEHMESSLAKGRMPYGMVLTKLFKAFNIDLSNESHGKAKNTVIGRKTFNQARIVFDTQLGIWMWNDVQVFGPHIDLLSDDPTVFETFYGPSASQPSRPPSYSTTPQPTTKTKKSSSSKLVKYVQTSFSKVLKHLSKVNKKLNYLYQLTPVDQRPETTLFDPSASSDDDIPLPSSDDQSHDDAPAATADDVSSNAQGSNNEANPDDDWLFANDKGGDDQLEGVGVRGGRIKGE